MGKVSRKRNAEIQAIETVYNGFRFRSRLEARWAVFFDALHIHYEYEKEGFKLTNGELYLPDFLLPDFNLWVEIKGKQPTDKEIGKIDEIGKGTKSDGAIVVYGLPGDFFDDRIGLIPIECSVCNRIGFAQRSIIVYQDRRFEVKTYIHPNWCGHKNILLSQESDRIQKAFIKARQARFEHGEKPKV